ncbi:hypothetical protein F8388_020634 [Cannabis sativa]|uniref:RNase H type-1 domain-containing protein n=1 Tax=Cannabis sativa TaxID=3483 RepID=A0A7J6F5C4_CANSA|nr:hypothetical protein F8388_020634 [Cannabis sativa]
MFDILSALHNRLRQSEFEDAIKVMWAIWENRNRKWNKLPHMNGIQLLDWVFSAYPNNPAQKAATNPIDVPPQPKLKLWKRPSQNRDCVNCDAAINQNSKGVGLGFIWRNWTGKIQLAGMVYIPCNCSTEMAEAWAIHEAIKHIPATITGPFDIQSDCQTVVAALNNPAPPLSAISTLLHKIKTKLEDFQDYKITHKLKNSTGKLASYMNKMLKNSTGKLMQPAYHHSNIFLKMIIISLWYTI